MGGRRPGSPETADFAGQDAGRKEDYYLLIPMKKYGTITVIGRDKTGVVARITNFLFLQKANIEALEEQVTRGQFSMTVQTSWKVSELDGDAVGRGLEKLAAELEMEIKVRFTEPRRRQRMAIMVTREPHCFQTILGALKSGALAKAEPALVLSNRRDLESLAQKHRLPFIHIPWEEFVTLVHETAHELLHKAERRTFTTATVRETEAEAVAFIVGQSIGLEMGNASSDYIQMYNGNATLLAESLEVIQHTSALILTAIREEEIAEAATEPEQFAAA